MDDLAGKLGELLNNPEALEQIKGLSGLLGVAPDKPKKEEPKPPLGADSSAVPADMMKMMMKLMPLLSSINQEDDSTRLLHALRPLLSDKRKAKLDESVRMMQMFKILPLLKQQGIF